MAWGGLAWRVVGEAGVGGCRFGFVWLGVGCRFHFLAHCEVREAPKFGVFGFVPFHVDHHSLSTKFNSRYLRFLLV